MKAADTLTPLELFKELLELINRSNLPEAQRQRALELVSSLKTHLAISDEAVEDSASSSRKYQALRDDLSNLSDEYDDLDILNGSHKGEGDSSEPGHHP